jgi:hypothetical protein
MRTMLTFLLQVLLLSGVGPAQADPVYRWVDRDGITHFSQTPPTEENAEVQVLELAPLPPADPAVEEYYSVARQAERMEARRLQYEQLRAEQLKAEAALRQAQAASAAPPAPPIEPEPRYLYYPYPAYPAGPYYYPHWNRHPHNEWRQPDADYGRPRSPGPNFNFADKPLQLQPGH